LVRHHARAVKQLLADYLSEKPGWQVIVVPRATVTLEASKQPGSDLHPKKLELAAGRASNLTTVPTGKNALQAPEPLPEVMVQSIPAGCEVTCPLPVPPGRIAMLPLAKWKASHTVMTACLSVLKSPPTVPMITADCALVTCLVETVKVALVDPAGMVTLGGNVAAAVLSLVRSTVKPPEGAAELRVTVPVAASGPTTLVGLTVSEESAWEAAGGTEEETVQPDRRAVAAMAEPSLTSTVQSAGAAKPLLSILKRPLPSLVPMATPSTVMVRLGLACPSILSWVPLSSAREMLTAASATDATISAPITTSMPTRARRGAKAPKKALRDVVVMVLSFRGRRYSPPVVLRP
jgi:hypothetical protein